MKKVSIIYWSNGGNVEVLANAISEGVIESEAKVDIKYVADTKFIDKWGDLMENYGFNVLEKFTVKDSVEKSDLKYAKEIGELLSK